MSVETRLYQLIKGMSKENTLARLEKQAGYIEGFLDAYYECGEIDDTQRELLGGYFEREHEKARNRMYKKQTRQALRLANAGGERCFVREVV